MFYVMDYPIDYSLLRVVSSLSFLGVGVLILVAETVSSSVTKEESDEPMKAVVVSLLALDPSESDTESSSDESDDSSSGASEAEGTTHEAIDTAAGPHSKI
jgi:hypothetical protein